MLNGLSVLVSLCLSNVVRAEIHSDRLIISEDQIQNVDLALEEYIGINGHEPTEIVVDVDGDMIALSEFLPDPVPVDEKYPEWEANRSQWQPLGIGIDQPGLQQGALSGKAIYLSQCHGWTYFESLGRFSTQRGNLYSTVEDFHNPEGMNQYLIQYLENAGAKVFTAKERDLNPNMSIADNDGAGYFEQGNGFTTGAAGFADESPWLYGENPFDAGTTRRFPSNGGAVASWIPEVPEDGYYSVYVSWDSDSDNDANAHYRITHNGGVIDRYYDQRVHGSTWQYTETLWLEAGVDSLTVELVGDSSSSGKWLSADAVRIGGGMGDVQRYGTDSGRPRWEEAAILYTQFNGAPTSVYDPYVDYNGSDPSARSRWAAWEHPSGEDAIYLSWHSNAGGGTGTDTFYDSSGPVTGSSSLAQSVHSNILDAIWDGHDSNWANRGVKTANFAEVNSSFNNEMPSILIELGFHDSAYDTDFLLDPKFRQDAARAMARGIVDYFDQRDGQSSVFLPEPPQNLRISVLSQGVQISWESGDSGGTLGGSASNYVLYSSRDGRSWDNGTTIAGTSTVVPFSNSVQYIRVAGQNAGGISFPSETLAMFVPNGNEVPILVVSAFDRLQLSSLFWTNAGSAVGDVKRMNLRRINSFDTIVEYAPHLEQLGYPFVSTSNERLTDFAATDFRTVIWIAGEESTADESFSDDEQAWIASHISSGGTLLASGAEILWDLDYQGSSSDQAFVDLAFSSRLSDDDARTYMANGVGILSGLNMNFSFDDGAQYNVEYPDVLESSATVIAEYDSGVGTGIAAVMTDYSVLFGFPLELIVDDTVQYQVLERILGEWLTDYVIEEPSTEPSGEPSTEPSEEPSVEPSTEEEVIIEEKRRGCSSAQGSLTWAWLLSLGMVWIRRRQ